MNRKICEEYVKVVSGEPIIFDNHEWIEIENNKNIQVLQCSVCKKVSSAKKVK